MQFKELKTKKSKYWLNVVLWASGWNNVFIIKCS